MRWDGIYLASTGLWLPPLESTEEAVAQGRYDAEECAENGYVSVAVSPGDSPAEMAARAGQQAVRRSGHDPRDFALVLHSGFYHQGQDYWTPASYVQENTIGGDAPAMEVGQMSNGGLAALELAAAYVRLDEERPAALITTGDRFCPPGFDRWGSEKGLLYGDAGTAIVVSSRGGFAQLVATSHVSEPALEALYRGNGFTDHSLSEGLPLDLRSRKKVYLTQHGTEAMMATMSLRTGEVVKRALEQAGVPLDGVARIVLPHLGYGAVRWQFVDALGIEEDRTTWAYGRRVGHLGAGDQLAALDDLAVSGALDVGDVVLLIGSGVGFTWSAVVLRIVEQPSWGRRE